MKKKSYNPFKMWGSYVGAGIGAILSIGLIMLFSAVIVSGWLQRWDILLMYGGVGIVIGFLLGWGIHSLIRRMRK